MSLGTLHVVKQSNKISSASVIFLHGSGKHRLILNKGYLCYDLLLRLGLR